jgi:hypothetical protein
MPAKQQGSAPRAVHWPVRSLATFTRCELSLSKTPKGAILSGAGHSCIDRRVNEFHASGCRAPAKIRPKFYLVTSPFKTMGPREGARWQGPDGEAFMPAFGAAYSDTEIAAVVNYVTARLAVAAHGA